MKIIIKCLVMLIGLIICCIILINCYKEYNEVLDKNKELYIKANNLNIIEKNGNINLGNKIEEKNNLIAEIKEKLKVEEYNDEEIDKLIDNIENNNLEMEEEIINLSSKKEKLIKERNTLNKQYEVLYEKYKLKQETIIINDVATINQFPKYPTGCESVALTILLNYYGYDVSVDDVISKLKLGKLPYLKDKIWYGGNPEIEFIGNPLDEEGFGVYEKPIYDVAVMYSDNVTMGTGKSLSSLLEIVKDGNPVMVWISYNLTVPYISKTWIYEPTMEKIEWKSGEHAVVIIGYNSKQIIVSDPYTGMIRYFDRATFENRYNYFGKKNIYLGSGI